MGKIALEESSTDLTIRDDLDRFRLLRRTFCVCARCLPLNIDVLAMLTRE